MKKLLFLIIPSFVVVIIIFLLFQLFVVKGSGKGALQITSVPVSSVYLNGKLIGKSPLCKCEADTMLPVGEYTIRLVPADKNLLEFQEKITITKSVLTVVDRKFGRGGESEGSIISLSPLKDKKDAQLLVISFPDKADISVDANSMGKTPTLLKDITESDHTLQVKKSGYREKVIRIRTPLGYKLTATVYLAINSVVPTPTPVASPSATPTPSITAVPVQVKVLPTPNGFLRVRESASLAAAEVGRVSTGDVLDVVEESEGWYKVAFGDGETGWVSAQYAVKQ
jgi:hypothetical protein